MSKYSLILSPNTSSNTRISVLELCVNGSSVFQLFIDEILEKGNLEGDLFGAIRNLELAADLKRLPKTKFRELKGYDINGKLYEAKYGSVRIYHFHEEHNGRIIVLGGLKSHQKKDIKSAVKTIKDYQNEKK